MNTRPKIKIPLTNFAKVLEVLTIIILISTWVYILFVYAQLPDKIPMHFNGKGEVDSFGTKNTIFIFLIIELLIYGLLTIISLNPHIHNYGVNITNENAKFYYTNSVQMLRILKLMIVAFMSYISYIIVTSAKNNTLQLGKSFLPIFLVTLYCIVGVYFYRQSMITRSKG